MNRVDHRVWGIVCVCAAAPLSVGSDVFVQPGGTSGLDIFQFSHRGDPGSPTLISRFGDDFTLGSATDVGSISFWGVSRVGTAFSSPMTGVEIEFFESAGGGGPGASVDSFVIPKTSALIVTTQMTYPNGNTVFRYDVELPSAVGFAGNTRYYLSVAMQGDVWQWQWADTTDGDDDSWQQFGFGGSPNWQNNHLRNPGPLANGDFAFGLQPMTVPLPGALGLGAVGLASAGVRRRR